MSAKENSDVNKDMGGVYPNRAGDVQRDENGNRIPPIRQFKDSYDPKTAPVYAGPEVMSGNKPNTLRAYLNSKTCPICESRNQSGAKFCSNCGNELKD